MTTEEYYTAPPDEVFEDIKMNAIILWSQYNNDYGYVTGKIDRIRDLQNIQDNAWYMVAMFDYPNQQKLLRMVKNKTSKMIVNALRISYFP